MNARIKVCYIFLPFSTRQLYPSPLFSSPSTLPLGERETVSPFPPRFPVFVFRLFLSTSAFYIYHSDRALCFLEFSVGDRGSMKRGDDESEVEREVMVDTKLLTEVVFFFF